MPDPALFIGLGLIAIGLIGAAIQHRKGGF
jgi:hypothetical protein